MTKKEARKEALKKRDMIPEDRRRAYSALIEDMICALPEYKRAENLFLYASFRSEVETIHLIERSIKEKGFVFLPRVLDETRMSFFKISSIKDLKRSRLGILEPAGTEERGNKKEPKADLFIIPLAAFSDRLDRLGYGGGYYDRYLIHHRGRAKIIAPAFSQQLMPEFETEESDIKPDLIITQDGMIFGGVKDAID